MRIIAGKYRAKKLFSPIDRMVRPTADRTREAIFNILYSQLQGNYSELILADIFAGTGAFGFEALSRGFKKVCFVDIDTALVQKNANLFCKEQDKIKIIKADATKLPQLNLQFDVVFFDAPYAKELSKTALQQVLKQNLLNKQSICIVEMHKDENFALPEEFYIVDERVYGIAKVVFLKLR